MKTAFIIDGGLGRCLCSLPALIKYGKLNPDQEWYVVMSGWTYITHGIRELQNRTFELESKGIFDNVFLKVDRVISPEPYRVPRYYKQELSLIEAFDFEINGTEDHSDLIKPPIVFSEYEEIRGKETINHAKNTHGKEKTIVIQPYGSSAQKISSGVFDDSLRSIPEKIFLKLSKMLSEKYNVIYFGDYKFYTEEYTHCLGPNPDPELREWFSIIKESDYFIGCDSCGQHAAYSVGTPGTVILGGTHAVNISYPKYFNIIQKQQEKKYIPMRISNTECDLSQRFNHGILNYDDKEIQELFDIIVFNIEQMTTTKVEEPQITSVSSEDTSIKLIKKKSFPRREKSVSNDFNYSCYS